MMMLTINSQEVELRPVKNLIIFIADGLSLSNKTLARIYSVGPYGKLYIDSMEITGYMTNHSADSWISDSAANSTAISTGQKTGNGKVATLPNGKIKSNFIESLSIVDKKIGIVTNGSPASPALAPYYAHADSYEDKMKIIDDLFHKNISVIFSSGEEDYLPQEENGIRTDSRNFIEEAQNMGYRFIPDISAMRNFSFAEKVIGVFSRGNIPFEIDRKPTLPSLAQMTSKAVSLLSQQESGFVLLVENNNLTKALGQLDVKASVSEIIVVDRTLKVLQSFVENNPDTLLLLVSGYDCGGFGVGPEIDTIALNAMSMSVSELRNRLNSTGSNIDEVMSIYAGIHNLSREETNLIVDGVNTPDLTRRLGYVISKRAGVHVLEPIYKNYRTSTATPIWATGKNSQLFNGYQDNTQVGKLLKELVGIK